MPSVALIHVIEIYRVPHHTTLLHQPTIHQTYTTNPNIQTLKVYLHGAFFLKNQFFFMRNPREKLILINKSSTINYLCVPNLNPREFTLWLESSTNSTHSKRSLFTVSASGFLDQTGPPRPCRQIRAGSNQHAAH